MLPGSITTLLVLFAILLMAAPGLASGRRSTPGGAVAAQAFLERLRALAAAPQEPAALEAARVAADAWVACVSARPVRLLGDGAAWLLISLSGGDPGDPRADAEALLARARKGRAPKSRPWF